MRTELINAAEGALGGIAGTLFIQQAMKLNEKLPAWLQPPSPSQDPGDFMISQVERVAQPLPEPVHGALARSLHFAYGTTWPALLGVFARRLMVGRDAKRAIATGAALGAGVWALGYLGWLPATGLLPLRRQKKIAPSLVGLLGHAAYGVIAVSPIALLDRPARRRPGLWRRLASIAF